MSYSRGVLIHNFNEDRYGQDLQRAPRPSEHPQVSVSSMVHHWKQPESQEAPDPAQGLERHILFGHSGDIHDPHTNLQRTEFATASQYFMQDPAGITDVGQLTAERYQTSNEPVRVSKAQPPSVLATKARSTWGDMRQSHAPTPDDRFLTSSMAAHTGQQGESFPRTPRHYLEFTGGFDAVKISR
jgi:hypothetical protein